MLFGTERVSDSIEPNANSPQTTADFPELGPSCLGDALTLQVGVSAEGEIGLADIYVSVISEDLDRILVDPSDHGHGLRVLR